MSDNIERGCEWRKEFNPEGDPLYSTACGEDFVFIDGTPKENMHFYCPNCGKRVTEPAND